MSGSIDTGTQAFTAIAPSSISSELVSVLELPDLQPGSPPSYQTCKTIYAYHPLGKKMVDAPIDMAQSQKRELSVPGHPEERLLDAFNRVWETLGDIGADTLIAYAMRLSRIYGIAALGMGLADHDPAEPIDRKRLHEYGSDLYFSVFDPLNTAGSLVLEQDPNKPDFQKPTRVRVGGQLYHPANIVVHLNEQPLYIEWSNSAFGFSGRSVFQRALYPLKSYIQTMRTNDLVSYKAGVIVSKMKSPTSATNGRIAQMFGWKRQQIKNAATGNVLGIGVEDSIESIDLKNLEMPFRLARENIIKDCATAGDMPARVLDQETLSGSALADGTEDAKNIARWVERFRVTMRRLYLFFDDIVQRIAWSPQFFEDLQAEGYYPGSSYEAVFYRWRNAFRAEWPNLLIEPERERLEGEKMRFESTVALYEVLAAKMDAENLTALTQWVVDEVNSRKQLFNSEMIFDDAALTKELKRREEQTGAMGEPEPFVQPFSSRS